MLTSDAILLALALVLLVVGLQAFFDPERRQVASEVIRATLFMVAGLYLLYYWYQGVAASKGSSSGYL
jgi:uncharacterized protein YjeT (DUF2065 family)